MSILITGATGKVGQALTQQLLGKGASVVILARDVAKAEKLFPGTRVVQGDTEQVDTVAAAMVGVERVFLLTNNPLSEGQIARAAKAAGVKQLVKISGIFASVGAEPGSIIHKHGIAEQEIALSGVPWVILRSTDFMQNLLATSFTIKTMNKFFGAFDQAAISSIDLADVAACAAAVLTAPLAAHNYRGYSLTGPTAVTKTELAALLSSVIGRTVEYVEVGDAAYKAALQKAGMPEEYAHMILVLAQIYRLHLVGNRWASGNVEVLTGRKARTWNEFLQENRAAF